MQIKERGSRLVFLRFVYNPEKKRTENRSIGTQPLYLDTLDSAVESKMDNDEIAEAKAWLKARAENREITGARFAVKSLPNDMLKAIESLDNPDAMAMLSKKDFDAIYKAWSQLASAMREAGFKRPRSDKSDK